MTDKPNFPPDLIEKVARAICEKRREVHGDYPGNGGFDDYPDEIKPWVLADATAALQATLEALREPSEEMIRALELKIPDYRVHPYRKILEAILNAFLNAGKQEQK